jgi:tetratricopeptide (TPR) repeat protein
LGAANALGLLGDKEGGQGHIIEARAYYQRALKILQGLGEHRKTALILNNMAIGFTNEGNLERGEQLYRQARSHFEQAGDKSNTAATVANIADILYLRGNLPAAEKGYRQAVEILASVDQGDPGYALCRLADLALMQGRVQDAHRLATQAIDSLRAKNFDTHEAISELGDVLEAEGNLSGARQQYQAALDVRQSRGRALDVAESQASLGALALEEGHPDQAEAWLRSAIAECEKEKAGPSAASNYVVLSRALLMQNKLEESRQGIRHAADLARGSPDPTLNLPIVIQVARIETSAAGTGAAGRRALDGARQQLRSAIATARKLGFYEIECEARLTLAEVELRANPAVARSQLEALDKETRERGLELISRKARQLAAKPLSSSHS